MLVVALGDPVDAGYVVEALLRAGDAAEAGGRVVLARRYRRLAGELGDALDGLPPPGLEYVERLLDGALV